MKTLISLVFLIYGVCILAQPGKISEVLSTCTVSNEIEKKITCKLVHKINAIENDTLSFVSLAFNDEFKNGNKGYVYLSSPAELNSFVGDAKSALANLMENNVFESTKPKYKIEVREFTKYKGSTPYHFKKICIYETLGGSGESYISFGPEKFKELLNWLENIRL
jgi:hypothetical protein